MAVRTPGSSCSAMRWDWHDWNIWIDLQMSLVRSNQATVSAQVERFTISGTSRRIR
jgi:hypothetical protein